MWCNSKLLFATGVSKSEAEDEKKRQREEKRLARQKEIEAKRAAKKGGAMKLGSKLSWSHFWDIDTTLIYGIDKPLIAFLKDFADVFHNEFCDTYVL